MTYRTLGELRSELLARLGMGAMGASGGSNATMIDSFLRNAQAQLYRMQDWKHLTDYQDKTLGTSQNLLDYPDAGTLVPANTSARDKRVLRIETEHAGQWRLLEEGIRTADWDTMDTESYPSRFERLAQILVYPKADQAYTVRIWFVADLTRFTQDNDRPGLDDEMIFLHALANAKAHYRQPDAATYQGQLNTMLATLRGQSFKGVYRRDDRPPAEPRPVVV
jgi:hypothetical protein